MTVLVVDDQEEIVWMHREILTKAGYKTIGANNGVEAKEVLLNHEIKLILSDIQMPEMNGIEFLNWKEINHPEIPLILCSGTILPHQTTGHKAFLSKPVCSDTLTALVDEILRTKPQATK